MNIELLTNYFDVYGGLAKKNSKQCFKQLQLSAKKL